MEKAPNLRTMTSDEIEARTEAIATGECRALHGYQSKGKADTDRLAIYRLLKRIGKSDLISVKVARNGDTWSLILGPKQRGAVGKRLLSQAKKESGT